MLVVNALSAAMVGIQTEHAARTLSEQSNWYYTACDGLFLVLFAVEAFLRLYVYRLAYFTMCGWGWNVFDLVLVTLQFVEMAFVRTLATGKDLNTTFMLRVVRASRIIKLFRVMQLVGEFRLLLSCIVHSMAAFFWAMVLLFLMNYVVGTYMVQVTVRHKLSEGLEDDEYQVLKQYYGSVPVAIRSIYLGLTGGLDWYDIVEPLWKHISPWSAIFFVIFMLFAILALMNVIVGTFVQNVIERAEKAKRFNSVLQVKKLFKSLDVDSSGQIGFAELESHLTCPEVQDYFQTIDVDITEAKCLFEMLDMNDSGSIDFEEFLAGCIRLQGPAKSLDLLMVARDMRCAFERQTARLASVEYLCHSLCANAKPPSEAATQPNLAEEVGRLWGEETV